MQRWRSLIILGLIGLGIISLIGASLLAPKPVRTPPISYEVPIHVLTPVTTIFDGVTLQTTRCNNTNRDIAITVSVFWQSGDNFHLVPFINIIDPLNTGPEFTLVIHPGCIVNSQSTLPIPQTLTPGTWRLKGLACYGGIALTEKPSCTGWSTEDFQIQ